MVLRTIAVTGASGTLGRCICHTMRQSGSRVVGCGRHRPAWVDACDWVEWDLTEWIEGWQFDQWLSGIDTLVHAGAAVPSAATPLDDRVMLDANVRACANIAAWALDRGRPLVYISGAIVYENPEAIGVTEDMPLGRNWLGGMYGISKLLGEQVIGHYKDRGLKTTILRPSSVYGVGMDDSKTLIGFLRRALKNEAIELRPPVDDSVDLVHAADVAEAIRCAIETEWFGVANIASGRMVSMLELAEACVRTAGAGRVVVCESDSEPRPPVSRFGLDVARAERELGWRAEMNLDRALREIVQDLERRESFASSQ